MGGLASLGCTPTDRHRVQGARRIIWRGQLERHCALMGRRLVYSSSYHFAIVDCGGIEVKRKN